MFKTLLKKYNYSSLSINDRINAKQLFMDGYNEVQAENKKRLKLLLMKA